MPEIKAPLFADQDFYITEYGAKGDGIHRNTESIARAVEDCSLKGGGRVVVPAGVWRTGPISLRSNVNLHVQEGALVVFSKCIDDYPLVSSNFEGQDTVRCVSPINGMGLENIAITGKGIFDGSGEAWRPVKRSKMTESQWNRLVHSGGFVNIDSQTWWPEKQASEGEQFFKKHKAEADREAYESHKRFARPTLLNLTRCQKILLDGPTFQNSPAWCIHLLLCDNVTISNISVRNPWYAQNGDGLDLDSCKNVMVSYSDFDVGDDAICMKSGKDQEGRDRGVACEKVSICNCTVYHGHGGFVVGSEMSGDVRNIHVSDCIFIGTDVGIRLKSCRGRGGVVEKICIDNIRMKDILKEGILMTTRYDSERIFAETEVALPISEGTPEFRDISIQGITCIHAGQAISILGLPEMPIKNIHLENCCFNAEKGVKCAYGKDLKFHKMRLLIQEDPILPFRNCSGTELSEIEKEKSKNL
jgi:polygalacturonase